jgi:hypothetical protein
MDVVRVVMDIVTKKALRIAKGFKLNLTMYLRCSLFGTFRLWRNTQRDNGLQRTYVIHSSVHSAYGGILRETTGYSVPTLFRSANAFSKRVLYVTSPSLIHLRGS